MNNHILHQSLDFVPLLEEPQPPAVPQEQSFPVLHSDALHGLAGDVVAACTQDTEATPPGVLFYFLLRFGCQIGAFPYVPVGEEKHHARLNVVLVGKSAKARKGTSMRPVDAIFEEVAKHGLSTVDVRNSNLSSGEGLVAAVRDDSTELDKDGNTRYPGVHDKRCLMVSEEFASALASMKRQGNTLSAVIRSLWDIGNADIVTKSEQIKTTGAHVSLMCHITEVELVEMLESKELFNGFANRFLWVKVRREKKIAIPKKIDPAIKADIAKRIAHALQAGGQTKPVALDDEAHAYWESLYQELSEDEGKGASHDGATSRAEPYVLRLALIYALLDCSDTITSTHLRAAKACWDYCDASAGQVFASKTTKKELTKQGRILQTLWQEGPCSTTRLYESFNRNISRDELHKLLDTMEKAKMIRKEDQKPETGKPSVVWYVSDNR